MRDQLARGELQELVRQLGELPQLADPVVDQIQHLSSSDLTYTAVQELVRHDAALTDLLAWLVQTMQDGSDRSHVAGGPDAMPWNSADCRPLLTAACLLNQLVPGQPDEPYLATLLGPGITGWPPSASHPGYRKLRPRDTGTSPHSRPALPSRRDSHQASVARTPCRLAPPRPADGHAVLAVASTTAADHTGELGAWLLERWGLPIPICEAICFQHQPSLARACGITPLAAVHVARALDTDEQGSGDSLAIDHRWLEQQGLVDRLASWRECSLQVAG